MAGGPGGDPLRPARVPPTAAPAATIAAITATASRRLRAPPGHDRPSLQRGSRSLDQLAAGRVPLGGRLRERGREHVVECRGELGPEFGETRRRLVQVSEDHRELALAVERPTPCEALEEDAAERVDVGAAVDVAALDLLGRDVVDRADEAAIRRQAARRGKMAGEAEVAHVRVLCIRFLAEEDVRRLHVAVHEPRCMRRIERLGDLRDEADRALGIQPALAPEKLTQVDALHVAPSRDRGRRLPRRRRRSARREGDRGSPQASTPAGSAFGSACPLRDRARAP